MTDRELMQQALDALEWCYDVAEWPANGKSAQDKAIEALRARLAQPEQETVAYTGNGTAGRESDVKPTVFFFQMPKPVGEVYGWHGTGKGQPMCRFDATEASMPIGTKLYTAPPQREWVGLTIKEIYECEPEEDRYSLVEFARAIEAKLKEKNT